MRLGEKVAGLVQMNDCIVLSGDLGAGKTQFAKGFAAGLGVDDDITSPTFNICSSMSATSCRCCTSTSTGLTRKTS